MTGGVEKIDGMGKDLKGTNYRLAYPIHNDTIETFLFSLDSDLLK